MTLLIDAAPLVALADRRDPLRHAVREVLETERGALVIAAPVTAERQFRAVRPLQGGTFELLPQRARNTCCDEGTREG